MSEDLRKFDIINILGRRYDLRSYLEWNTPTTGHTFAKVDAGWFAPKDRLVYRCPPHEDDGNTYTYRTSANSSRDIAQAIFTAKSGIAPYDLIFVDPWHTYQASMEDLEGAWRLLRPGGFMVVHDCNPPDEKIANPEFQKGDWCGETYRAYIDFLSFRTDAVFDTVDTDYGCGVVRKLAASREGRQTDEQLLLTWLYWKANAADASSSFAYFDSHRSTLLRLTDVESFLRREG